MRRKVEPRVWDRTYLLNHAMIRDLRDEIGHRFTVGWGGRILDVGCGQMPYRPLFQGRCAQYVGCDHFPSAPGVVACPADALSFGEGEFDAVVAFQVLEHVPRPARVVAECARVLKPGGLLILTAPFLFPHHASPADYWRYSHEGLRLLAGDAGLEVDRVRAQCSSLSTVFLLLSWYNGYVQAVLDRHPVTRPLAWAHTLGATIPINVAGLLAGRVPFGVDPERGNLGFSNYMIVARKPGDLAA